MELYEDTWKECINIITLLIRHFKLWYPSVLRDTTPKFLLLFLTCQSTYIQRFSTRKATITRTRYWNNQISHIIKIFKSFQFIEMYSCSVNYFTQTISLWNTKKNINIIFISLGLLSLCQIFKQIQSISEMNEFQLPAYRLYITVIQHDTSVSRYNNPSPMFVLK